MPVEEEDEMEAVFSAVEAEILQKLKVPDHLSQSFPEKISITFPVLVAFTPQSLVALHS